MYRENKYLALIWNSLNTLHAALKSKTCFFLCSWIIWSYLKGTMTSTMTDKYHESLTVPWQVPWQVPWRLIENEKGGLHFIFNLNFNLQLLHLRERYWIILSDGSYKSSLERPKPNLFSELRMNSFSILIVLTCYYW